MTDEHEEQALYIYVLPTENGLPPRALLMESEPDSTEDHMEGALAVWSVDMGIWTADGSPLPQELSEAITAHAKDLGVSW